MHYEVSKIKAREPTYQFYMALLQFSSRTQHRPIDILRWIHHDDNNRALYAMLQKTSTEQLDN